VFCKTVTVNIAHFPIRQSEILFMNWMDITGVASKVPIMHMGIVGVQVEQTGSSPSSYLSPTSYFSLPVATSVFRQLLLSASRYFCLPQLFMSPTATSVSHSYVCLPAATSVSRQLLMFASRYFCLPAASSICQSVLLSPTATSVSQQLVLSASRYFCLPQPRLSPSS
jgi:hypothetical protein